MTTSPKGRLRHIAISVADPWEAAEFYKRFLEVEGGSPAVRHEGALAWQQVGDIRGMLGEYAGADQAYHQSLQLFQGLVEEAPGQVIPRLVAFFGK